MIFRASAENRQHLFLVMYHLVSFTMFFAMPSHAQDKDLRREAFELFDLNRMFEAEPRLRLYCKNQPKDAEAQYRWAESLYQTNKLDQAITQLRSLKNTNKRYAAKATFLLARAHHHKHFFADAIKYYKEYLTLTDTRNTRRAQAVNDIKRCAQGLSYSLPSDQVFLENMGLNVNTTFDDFAPISSPNVESRIYFTSNRSMKVKDRFSDEGSLITSTQNYDCDMFATEIENGAWSTAFPLNEDLNTEQHELLQDFNRDGMVAFFVRGSSYDQVSFYVDSFANDTQEAVGVPWAQLGLKPQEQVRGIHFFSDSTILFSSNREDGFGGFDLYISILGAEGWTEPINLGREINGPFDEITPFMTKDGRTLYFSSNRLTSIGGHDVFKSRFNERSLQWGEPSNLSIPINSAANDVHYRLTSNGQTANFSSDRKTGKGGQDLYAVYFKKPVQEQLVRSMPSIFYMVKDFQLFSEQLVADGSSPASQSPVLESQWDLKSILYREDDQILTTQNKPKLDQLVRFLKTYPHVKLEILSHSDQSSVSNFDLFFSIKRAESVAGYLAASGVNPEHLFLKGFGGSYPYTLNAIGGQDNKAGRFFNRRIDFKILNADQLPIEVNEALPEVASAQHDPRLAQFYSKRRGLYYRVEFAILDQLFKGNLIGKYPDPCIEKRAGETNYRYSSGIFSSFALALQHLAEIKAEGFDDCKIIPYEHGVRLGLEEIDDAKIDLYPDLQEFMLYLK